MPGISRVRHYLLLILLMLQGNALADDIVNIGVLAFRGTTVARIQWEPLADQLSESIPDAFRKQKDSGILF
ncbi:hypothetical protein [Kaarinaea lacus]